MKKFPALFLLASSAAGFSAQAEGQPPIMLELFTSQGCSSCPYADTLLQELAKDPSVVALSFHVHYWDYLGWKDPFASPENTNRQNQYARNLSLNAVFTPQLMVSGAYSAAGNDKGGINDAIATARKEARPVPITIAPDAAGKVLNVHVDASSGAAAPSSIFAVRYLRHASTRVGSGENAGRTLTSINNVTELSKLGIWQDKASDFQLPIGHDTDEGIAVFVQSEGQGRILGAQYYPK